MDRLQIRIATAQIAEEKLEVPRRDKNASKQEMATWAEQVRRGPPLLSSLHTKLQIDSKREEAKHLLNKLCDDAYAASTMGPPSLKPTNNLHHTPTGFSRAGSTRQPTQYLHLSTAARSHVPSAQRKAVAGQQGEEFGLSHDPGEQKGGTVPLAIYTQQHGH